MKKIKLSNLYLHHQKSFLFIHIPKTGGTSIANAFGLDSTRKGHVTIQEAQSMLETNVYKNYYKFCIVRNPIDRFISLYNYARMEESFYHSVINPEKALDGKHQDYDILVSATLDEAVQYLIQGKLVHSKNSWNLWQPQWKWILDSEEHIGVDFIGRYENIQNEFKKITNHLGYNEIKLPHFNRSKTQNKKNISISDTAINRLKEYYNRDFELFNYV